jgi:hypothetical protein
VIDNLGMGAVDHDITGPALFVVPVRRDGHVLDPVIAGPDHDVLPVVRVARGAPGVGPVLLKVVGVHVGAPAVVAAAARVQVPRGEVLPVAAAADDGACRARLARVELTAAADGGHVVAAVRVKVEHLHHVSSTMNLLGSRGEALLGCHFLSAYVEHPVRGVSLSRRTRACSSDPAVRLMAAAAEEPTKPATRIR